MLVIFDNDGVLVDSERLANTILAGLLTEAGLPYTFDEAVRDFMGGSMVSMRQKAEARLGRPLPADLEDRYHEQLFAGFEHLRAVPGVREVLDHLDAAGTEYCVASSGTHRRIRTALTTVGFWDRFEGRVFSAEDVTHGKPAPDLFLHAASTLGVKPADCVVVEDSPLGVAAANAAGMKVYGYAAMTDPAKLASATGIFHQMTALPTLLDAA
ncbi:HAD superfamily hydrolase (TIGR01509 family) [Kribbella amoyensis]|uniref:HAD superfamily hydrolase (TIGR01509 family) n=1 Tax=Kribbella amoyensis TaxID=996641 RepID=A0A561BKR3_9ACTN|nr:HAD family phosphatase [Kribbella amoyensis]TWD79435.1 HAD superfamily hydrolase (TIGR01509 family) [Kribbella amoyensis]